jgi:hypothetical protein
MLTLDNVSSVRCTEVESKDAGEGGRHSGRNETFLCIFEKTYF